LKEQTLMTPPELELPALPGHSRQWEVPPFDRLSYFYGQVLTPQQLQRAQKSIYDRAMLHNRCLHGWGVVCGLAVKAAPPPAPDCPPEQPRLAAQSQEAYAEVATRPERPLPPERPPKPDWPNDAPARIWVTPGLALDSLGHELVVREPMCVELLTAMSKEDQRADFSKPVTLYVSLRYHTSGIEPARPQLPESCGFPPELAYTFWRDGACVEVTLKPPEQDERCETCCTPAPVHTVLLARIDGFIRGQPLRDHQIHNEVRRPISLRVPTVITEVSWHHGGSYRADDVDALLWNHGVRVRFSRPIYAETLQPGTFDVLLIEMGKGRSGIVRMLKGDFVPPPQPGKEGEPPVMVKEITYRLTDNERVDPGDRIVFVLRTGFLLDACCAPVDGSHVGGRIPAYLPKGYPSPVRVPPVHVCHGPPRRFGAWTTGDGAGGGTFESWIFVAEERGRIVQKKEEER
jgi:hypothetical protein